MPPKRPLRNILGLPEPERRVTRSQARRPRRNDPEVNRRRAERIRDQWQEAIANTRSPFRTELFRNSKRYVTYDNVHLDTIESGVNRLPIKTAWMPVKFSSAVSNRILILKVVHKLIYECLMSAMGDFGIHIEEIAGAGVHVSKGEFTVEIEDRRLSNYYTTSTIEQSLSPNDLIAIAIEGPPRVNSVPSNAILNILLPIVMSLELPYESDLSLDEYLRDRGLENIKATIRVSLPFSRRMIAQPVQLATPAQRQARREEPPRRSARVRAMHFRGKNKMFYRPEDTRFLEALEMNNNAVTRVIPINETNRKYFHRQAVTENNVLGYDLCLPMAILMCQARMWEKEDNKWVVHTTQSKNLFEIEDLSVLEGSISSDHFMILTIPDEYWNPEWNNCQFWMSPEMIALNHYPEEVKTPARFIKQKQLVLFNPYPCQPHHYNLWVTAAEVLHLIVEERLNRFVDVTSWNEAPQAYADALGIAIHVYRKGVAGRVDCYKPNSTEEALFHIYVMHTPGHDGQPGHFDPVTCIHKLCGIKYGSQLCDICQKQWKRTVDQKHLEECMHSQSYVSAHVCEFISKVEHREWSKPVRPHIFKGKKQFEPVPYCRQCQRFYPDNEPCEHMNSIFQDRVDSYPYICNCCRKIGPKRYFEFAHRCQMQVPPEKPNVEDSSIYALDIESRQVQTEQEGKLSHECILICIKALYSNDQWTFASVGNFLDYLILQKDRFKGSLFIAHNGGGYDYQFFVMEFEKRDLLYTFVNQANSRHKYLSIECPDYEWRFHDFMALVPGSLRNIGKALQCNVQKGDFPHNFFCHYPLTYEGAFPPLHHEHDFYGLKYKRSEEDIIELETWWNEIAQQYCTCWETNCSCQKRPWNAMHFLQEYCMKDVAVLAEAAVKYRSLLLGLGGSSDYQWTAKPVDPFHCITQSQLAQKIFLQGFDTPPTIHTVIPKKRANIDWKGIYWLLMEQIRNPNHRIDHIGNNDREYYFIDHNMYYTGVCLRTKTAYLFHNCLDLGCHHCCPDHPHVDEMERKLMNYAEYLRDPHCGWNELRIMRLCEFEEMIAMDGLDDYYKECAQFTTDREFFYGGRTEVFSPYASAEKLGMDIKYHDVCSLYPTVCSFKTMPHGKPFIYFADECDLDRLNPQHPDPYFGFAKVKVKCNRDDILGLLPLKIDGKLTFDVRNKVGMWFTEEIYLAMQSGYIIEEIYEVHHFDSSNRTDTLMRGYMEYFLRMKQEAEGWKKLGASSDTPSEDEKEQVCQAVFVSNGNIAKPRAANVTKNPTMRHVAKIFLNCLWGKFCQRAPCQFDVELSSFIDYHALLNHKDFNRYSAVFRHINNGRWRCTMKGDRINHNPNNRYNIYIAAAVTAHARCYLHTQMIKIGPERILYCDTDSIVFLYGKNEEELSGTGLGKWTDEYPGDHILEFSAIAPKCYCIKSSTHESVKTKGIPMTVSNQRFLTMDSFKQLVEAFAIENNEPELAVKEFNVNNFQIAPNSTDVQYAYAQPMTRYNQKLVRCVFSKRVLECHLDAGALGVEISRVRLYPIGHSLLGESIPNEYHHNYDQEDAAAEADPEDEWESGFDERA